MINKNNYVEYIKEIKNKENNKKLYNSLVCDIKENQWFKDIEKEIDENIKKSINLKNKTATIILDIHKFENIKKHITQNESILQSYLICNKSLITLCKEIMDFYIMNYGNIKCESKIKQKGSYILNNNQYWILEINIPISQFQEDE